MVNATNKELIRSKHKAIIVLFLYAVHPGRSGEEGVVSRAVMALNSGMFIWRRAIPLIMKLPNTQSSPALNWVITLGSPHVSWHDEPYDGDMVAKWAEAAPMVTYTEEVGRSVVSALLHIASVDSLRPHIPVEIWMLLKKQPSLPPKCLGRSRGSSGDVVRQVRALRDTEILKSYLVLVWSEWNPIEHQDGGLIEMEASLREDFSGIETWRHRQELIERLDHVIGQMGGRLNRVMGQMGRRMNYVIGQMGGRYPLRRDELELAHRISQAKIRYSKLKRVLLEISVETMDTLNRKPPKLIFFDLLTLIYTHRIPLDFHVRSSSPVSVIYWKRLSLFRPTTRFLQQFFSCHCVFPTLARRLRT